MATGRDYIDGAEMCQDEPRADAAGALTIGGDLVVNRIGFGALRLVGDHARGAHNDPERCRAVLKALASLDINLIDTSDAYGPFLSEEMIGDTLAPYTPETVIATKGGTVMEGERTVIGDGTPAHLRDSCEGSLRRLKVERIDLYQLHHVDPKVPLPESVGALDTLRREGKIRHIGLSNVTAAQLGIALDTAPIAAVQNRYNVVDQGCQEVLDICEQRGIAFLASQPLGGIRSLLAGVDPVRRVAERHGTTESQIAIAWLLARSESLVAIPGTASLDHLVDNVRAAALRLSKEDFAELATVPQIPWRSPSAIV